MSQEFLPKRPGHRILGGKTGIHYEFAVIPLGKIEAGPPADTDNVERSRRFPAGGDASLLNVRQNDLMMASDQRVTVFPVRQDQPGIIEVVGTPEDLLPVPIESEPGAVYEQDLAPDKREEGPRIGNADDFAAFADAEDSDRFAGDRQGQRGVSREELALARKGRRRRSSKYFSPSETKNPPPSLSPCFDTAPSIPKPSHFFPLK